MDFNDALGLVRYLILTGVKKEEALENPAIPASLKQAIDKVISEESTVVFHNAKVLSAGKQDISWLEKEDRSQWIYWPRLRNYLGSKKNWPIHTIDSIDEATDQILRHIPCPGAESFKSRGLVIGYVQSGKTANYTGLIAKAADVGYRLVIILSGIDNGLRKQTQERLDKELVGKEGGLGAVDLPPLGKRWHKFTTSELDGDFKPGTADTSALQGEQPVLLVVKKNKDVLEKLAAWLDRSPGDAKNKVPLLVIDDEADQASVDTSADDRLLPEDEGRPSTINSLIRRIVNTFSRSAYVAYTATPYANILIKHDRYDPEFKNDLYPSDFIIALPKPHGYFGAAELFGAADVDEDGGLDLLRTVVEEDCDSIERGIVPDVLRKAILSFILAAAGRLYREGRNFPAAMLIHTSRTQDDHSDIHGVVNRIFTEKKNEWRYMREDGIRDDLEYLWESDFRPVAYEQGAPLPSIRKIEECINQVFEQVQVKVVNSEIGDVLDYEEDPNQKVIAIGGDKLSRGLTIEGLLVSFFIRKSVQYDSLMQMGRWFGFRGGYADLTRIFTTKQLQKWFSSLAIVEQRLREDLEIYAREGVSPDQVGMRILTHPEMKVTNPLKARHAARTTYVDDYRTSLQQTFRFPFSDRTRFSALVESSWDATEKLLSRLHAQNKIDKSGVPEWENISAELILDYLDHWDADDVNLGLQIGLLRDYIKRCLADGELTKWVVSLRERQNEHPSLGTWYSQGLTDSVNLIRRTRLRSSPELLGVVTSPGDELAGLPKALVKRANDLVSEGKFSNKNIAARSLRDPTNGVLLLYPISKYSEPDNRSSNRMPLFENPKVEKNLVAFAISFPGSSRKHEIEAYIEGTVGGFDDY